MLEARCQHVIEKLTHQFMTFSWSKIDNLWWNIYFRAGDYLRLHDFFMSLTFPQLLPCRSFAWQKSMICDIAEEFCTLICFWQNWAFIINESFVLWLRRADFLRKRLAMQYCQIILSNGCDEIIVVEDFAVSSSLKRSTYAMWIVIILSLV